MPHPEALHDCLQAGEGANDKEAPEEGTAVMFKHQLVKPQFGQVTQTLQSCDAWIKMNSSLMFWLALFSCSHN
jgi:hypothetical protein